MPPIMVSSSEKSGPWLFSCPSGYVRIIGIIVFLPLILVLYLYPASLNGFINSAETINSAHDSIINYRKGKDYRKMNVEDWQAIPL